MNHTKDEIKAKLHELFTVEEIGLIKRAVHDGNTRHIASIVHIQDVQHEYWLGQFLDLHREAPKIDEVTKVELEVRELMRTNDNMAKIDSPEKEAFWQNRVDIEKAGLPLPSLKEALIAFHAGSWVPTEVKKEEPKPVENTSESPEQPSEQPSEQLSEKPVEESVEESIKEPPERPSKKKNEKAELIQELTALGVEFDKRWGVKKLKEALEGAKTAEPVVEPVVEPTVESHLEADSE